MAFLKIHPTTGASDTSHPHIETFAPGNFRQGDGSTYVRPPTTISIQATKVHGITNRDVSRLPPFSAHAHALYDFLKGCDLTGYNVAKFDIPILAAEFQACGIVWPPTDGEEVPCVVDTLKLFHGLSRNLELAHIFFTDQEMVGAHNAEMDTKAAMKVLFGMVREDRLGMRQKVEDMLTRSEQGMPRVTGSGKEKSAFTPRKRPNRSTETTTVDRAVLPNRAQARSL